MAEEKILQTPSSWQSFVPSQKANYVLGSLALGFLASLYFKVAHPSIFSEGAYYILEAALVGGIADWFAVEALFRHPLGFPYHTAIIPSYRKELTAGCGSMVAKEFLTRRKLIAERNNFSFVDAGLELLNKENNRNKVKGVILEGTENFLCNVDTLALASKMEAYIKTELNGVDFYTKLDEFLADKLKPEKNNALYDFLIAACSNFVRKQEVYDYIRARIDEKVAEEKGKYGGLKGLLIGFLKLFNQINEEELADKLHQEAILTVDGLRTNENLRAWFMARVQRAVEVFHSSSQWQANIQKLQQGLVNDLELKYALDELIQNTIAASLRPEGNATDLAKLSILAQIVNTSFDALENELRTNAELSSQVENYCKHLGGLMILKAQSMLSPIISRIMNKLTDEDLNKLIRSKVDEDLTYIRLNGSIVGGCIGALIFLLKLLW